MREQLWDGDISFSHSFFHTYFCTIHYHYLNYHKCIFALFKLNNFANLDYVSVYEKRVLEGHIMKN